MNGLARLLFAARALKALATYAALMRQKKSLRYFYKEFLGHHTRLPVSVNGGGFPPPHRGMKTE